MSKKHKMLLVNLGSTSTKLAVSLDREIIFVEKLTHEADQEFNRFKDIWEQYEFRKAAILEELGQRGYEISYFDALVSRGAPVRPMNSGCYVINAEMIADAKSGKYGNHPCSVGCEIAYELAAAMDIWALTVDAPCIDELIPQARVTGIKGVERKSYYQALNQKAIGRRLARELGMDYDEMNAVIVHMGGGTPQGSDLFCRKKVASVIVGTSSPVIMTSRSDSV